jgi:hypothetical protein
MEEQLLDPEVNLDTFDVDSSRRQSQSDKCLMQVEFSKEELLAISELRNGAQFFNFWRRSIQ